MAKILLIDTATPVCSAAIAVDGKVVALAEDTHALNHAALLTLQIGQCVKISGIALRELDAIAVSAGPGAYTSLRVGASVAKGICYALDKPLIGINTLYALAHASRARQGHFDLPSCYLPMLDARRNEVWLAAYDQSLVELLPAQPLILINNSLENLLLPLATHTQFGQFLIQGNGAKKVEAVGLFERPVILETILCSAADLSLPAEKAFQQADFQDIAYFEPFYMKPPNITTPNQVLLGQK